MSNNSILIKNARIVNQGEVFSGDVLIKRGRIEKVDSSIQYNASKEINAEGLFLLPGLIDDQVHFREPGLTHKADIWHESRAAVAGGTTSFMEMPNTVPNTLTQELLEEKYQRAAEVSLANYSFYMGASNDNLAEVLRTNPRDVCGIKVFMGSSTGNMLVDNSETLSNIFAETPMLIATHCEDEATIKRNLEQYKAQYGEDIQIEHHPLIRSADACFISSSKAVELAKKHDARLHILHISTAKEVGLFDNKKPLAEKRITAEACVHHLWFSDADYVKKGNFIKWNPAVKTSDDRDGILAGLLSGKIDVIATDHAPHTLQEKEGKYLEAPSGGPLVQHALLALLDLVDQKKLTMEQLVEKTAHNTATCFQIENRGFIKEGYWADLVLVDPANPFQVKRDNILSKCGWSPFLNHTFSHSIHTTIVSGQVVYENGEIQEASTGHRLLFNR